MSATSIGEQISDAAMIAMDGVERILAKMHDAPKIDLGRLEKIDRQLLLYELQQCERKYLRLRNPSLHLTRPGLKRLKDLRGLLHDPKPPWRLLGVDDAVGTLTSKLDAFLAGPSTPLDDNPKELLVGQDLAFFRGNSSGVRPRLSRTPARKGLRYAVLRLYPRRATRDGDRALPQRHHRPLPRRPGAQTRNRNY